MPIQISLPPHKSANSFYRENMKILLVEDNAPIERLLSDAMRRMGYEVLAAHDGREATDILWGQNLIGTIDLAILDFRLPDMKGTEIAHQIYKAHPQIKILLISAYTEEVHDLLSVWKLPWQLMSKPFQAADLLLKVIDMMGSSI